MALKRKTSCGEHMKILSKMTLFGLSFASLLVHSNTVKASKLLRTHVSVLRRERNKEKNNQQRDENSKCIRNLIVQFTGTGHTTMTFAMSNLKFVKILYVRSSFFSVQNKTKNITSSPLPKKFVMILVSLIATFRRFAASCNLYAQTHRQSKLYKSECI